MILQVPVGTLAFDEQGATIADLATAGQRVLIALEVAVDGQSRLCQALHQAPRQT